jgi:hypothetical protein
LLTIAQGGVKNDYFIAHHYSPVWNALIIITQFESEKQKPQQLAGAGMWWLMNYFDLINSGLTRPKL